MKKSIILSWFAAIALLASCAGGPEKDPSAMTKEELKAYIKTKRDEMNTLKAQVIELQARFDTMGGIDPRDQLRIVETIPLNVATFEHFFEVQGSVTSEQNVTISPEMSGVIKKLLVEEGQNVSKGQSIAKLDDEMILQNIQEVEKRLELARELYIRQENLYKKKIGSEIQYLQAKNNKESLEESLETLKTQLGKTIVKSPISGTIDDFFVNEGEMGAVGMPMARIVNLNMVEVNCDVAENYLTDVKEGDSVTVTFPAIGREIRTKIHNMGMFINPSNRTFKITMKLSNKDGMLRPNTMAVVKIRDFIKPDAITAPNRLIQRSTSGDEFVFKITEESGQYFAKKVNVKTGMSYEGYTLIEEGLSKSDVLINKGFSEVTDNEEVRLHKLSDKRKSQRAEVRSKS